MAMKKWLLRRGIRTLGSYIQTTADADVLRRSRAQVASTARPPVATTVLLAFALAGCQTPPVKDRIVEVVKPVAVQPITPEQVPALPAPLPPRPDSLSAAADVLLGKVCEFVAYALKADPLLKVSAGQSPGEPPLFPECER